MPPPPPVKGAPPQEFTILKDLEAIAQKHNIEMVCLYPSNKTSLTPSNYNINKMLGYFRRKFLKGDVPTILSNDCSGGRMYEALGLTNISPLVNSAIPRYEDFIKLCQNPLKYFGMELTDLHLSRSFVGMNNRIVHDNDIAFYCGDIEVFFVHDKVPQKALERWNLLKERINPERFVYLLAERESIIPRHIVEEFSKLKGNKLILSTLMIPYGEALRDCSIMKWGELYQLGRPLENTFDLVGWINGGL